MNVPEQKQRLRQQAKLDRQQLTDRDRRSRSVLRRLMALPRFSTAQRVLWYVATADEVQTRAAIAQQLVPLAATNAGASDNTSGSGSAGDEQGGRRGRGHRVAVPYCRGERLQSAWIESLDELARGRFGIWEPIAAVQQAADRHAAADQFDWMVIPGVAFDRRGGRLGYGGGFYDRLLAQVPSHTTLVGLAFDCQLYEAIPREPHDGLLDWVVSESATIDCAASGR